MFFVSICAAEETAEKLKEAEHTKRIQHEASTKAQNFKDTFAKEIAEGWEELKKKQSKR